ncbi:hypothetical protein [Pararhodobacter sp.]|uniref:hypothetical protein n=1 Tax=Pararhodobacter sp. TaxID=2127056 RepID=UPI002AFDE477|nr:hypothetical protein [Pararhodobacter sp.]
MRRLFLILPILAASPGFAEVTHSVEAQFGVAYSSNSNQTRGQTQTLYSGRYTSRFSHQSDSGVMFRFEVGADVGNFEPHHPAATMRARGQISIGSE